MTGFGPFAGVCENPSGRVAGLIAASGHPGHDVTAAVLPVSFRRAAAIVRSMLVSGAFDAALLLGVASGECAVRLEGRARRAGAARMADIDGELPGASPPGGGEPAQRATPLLLAPICVAVGELGVPCRISDDAGSYVCNHVYFCAFGAIHEARLPTACLFVHLPPDEATGADPAPNALPLDRQVAAVRVIVDAVAAQLGAPGAGRGVGSVCAS